MRMQPLHRGHELVLRRMLEECDAALVGVGSVQEEGTEKNPFSYQERAGLLAALFPGEERLRPFPLRDIGAPTRKAWADYVLAEAEKAGLPRPERYYAGSEADASWFEESGLEIRVTCREKRGEGISATEIRRRLKAGESIAGLVPAALEEIVPTLFRNKGNA